MWLYVVCLFVSYLRWAVVQLLEISWDLTAHNWQNWKSRFPSSPCHKIYREEVVGIKSSNYTLNIAIFVNCEIWGNFLKNLYFVNNYLIKVRI